MGLVYNPAEVNAAIKELGDVINHCNDVIFDLKLANDNCLNTIDTSLNSAAVKVFENSVTSLFVPTLNHLKAALDCAQSDLNIMKETIKDAGSQYLDEDKLNQQMNLYVTLQTNLIPNVKNPTNVKVLKSYDQKMLETYVKNINTINEKLTLLHNLDSYTKNSFSNTLTTIETVNKNIQEISKLNLNQKDASGNIDVAGISSKIVTSASQISSLNVATQEGRRVIIKARNGTGYFERDSTSKFGYRRKRVGNTKSGKKTFKQYKSEIHRSNSVKGALKFDRILNGTGNWRDGVKGVRGFAKSLGILGVLGTGLEMYETYQSRVKKYGATNATIDAVQRGTTSVATIYASAEAGTLLLPIPVVGTIAGMVIGSLISWLINSQYDHAVNRSDQ